MIALLLASTITCTTPTPTQTVCVIEHQQPRETVFIGSDRSCEPAYCLRPGETRHPLNRDEVKFRSVEHPRFDNGWCKDGWEACVRRHIECHGKQKTAECKTEEPKP